MRIFLVIVGFILFLVIECESVLVSLHVPVATSSFLSVLYTSSFCSCSQPCPSLHAHCLPVTLLFVNPGPYNLHRSVEHHVSHHVWLSSLFSLVITLRCVSVTAATSVYLFCSWYKVAGAHFLSLHSWFPYVQDP